MNIWYKHIKKADYCVPNSVYVMIHSNLSNTIETNSELITIDDIGARLGYSQGYGSRVTSAKTQSLTRYINKKISTLTAKKFSVTVGTEDDVDFKSAYQRLKENQSVTVCFSFSVYREYFLRKKESLPCIQTSEPSLTSHCILLLPLNVDVGNVMILDPHCHCDIRNTPENIGDFLSDNKERLRIMDINEFRDKIFLVRRERIDVLNRQLIYVDVNLLPEERTKQMTLSEEKQEERKDIPVELMSAGEVGSDKRDDN